MVRSWYIFYDYIYILIRSENRKSGVLLMPVIFHGAQMYRLCAACVLYYHQRGGDFFVQNSPILPTISLTACRRNWPIAASPVGQASFGGQWPVRPLTSCKLQYQTSIPNEIGTSRIQHPHRSTKGSKIFKNGCWN